MRICFLLLLDVELISIVFCQLPIWNIKNSAIELFDGDKSTYYYDLYEYSKDGVTLTLTKELTKNKDTIIHENKIKINEKGYATEWEGIHNFYIISNKIYICPTGKNYLNVYENDEFKPIKPSESALTEDWDLLCHYQPNKNVLFISYLNSNDINIYAFQLSSNKWFNLPMHAGYLDIIWPTNIQTDRYNIFAINALKDAISIGKIEITIDSQISANMINKKNLNVNLTENYAFFDEDKYFYWITHNKTYYYSGYSKQPLNNFDQNPDNYEYVKNKYSPFEFMENIIINYLEFIRGTKYAYYEITENNKTYHGIIDVKLNKIIFNTNETLLYFKPSSKKSFLLVTNSNAYKICLTPTDEGEECLDKCENDQTIILDPENGNKCGESQICTNYVFMPSELCINDCDKIFYINYKEQDSKICGLCKNLKPDTPYKIINETSCRNDKPENTYYYNEQYLLLDYCDKSCKTCEGKKDNQCLSCDNKELLDGKCINKDDNQDSSIPDDNDDKPDKNGKKKGIKWWGWLIIIIIIIILIAIGIILFRKYRNKNKNQNLVENVNNVDNKQLINEQN